MFERLKSLFRGAPPGGLPPIGASFAESHIFFLCLPERFANGIPIDTPPEEFEAYVRAAAEDLASSQAYQPFSYDEAGHRVLPLFTSEHHVQQFVQAHVARVQRIIPFQVLGVRGESLVSTLQSFDEIIMNPGTPDAAILRSRQGAVGRHGV